MANTVQPTETLICEFTENYMKQLFFFCLKKTGNHFEAEDLAQDISLHILTALSNGTIPTCLSAWVWQIARNRYCFWADQKRKKTESVTGSDIGDHEIEDKSESILDQLISREQLSLLRRELALIGSDYRNIVVAYYIEDKSVRQIASSLSLSEDTVKQRLHRARKMMKEGMNMAREFGKRSYRPEDIVFTQNSECAGIGGLHYVERLIPKNILLEAYDNPSTAEALSLELGIALPYLEEELARLTDAELVTLNAGKYTTNIVILSREAQEALARLSVTFSDKLVPLVMKAIDEIKTHPQLPQNQCFEEMKLAITEMYVSSICNRPTKSPFALTHKDGSCWALMGFEKTDIVPRFIEVCGNSDFHQIILIGDRTDENALQIDQDTVPTFSRKSLTGIFATSYNTEINALMDEFSDLRDAILRKEIPKTLQASAMYRSGIDFRLHVIEKMIGCGYITLPERMNTSSVGVWNYGE